MTSDILIIVERAASHQMSDARGTASGSSSKELQHQQQQNIFRPATTRRTSSKKLTDEARKRLAESAAPNVAKMLMRKTGAADAQDFNSSELSYQEFSDMMVHLTGTEWTAAQLKEWFNALDADKSGTISLDEFFAVSIRDAQAVGGAKLGLKEVFEEFDSNGSGLLEFREFERAAKKMGYGAVARELFEVFDDDGSGSVQYEEILSNVHEQEVPASAKSFLLAILYRPRPGSNGPPRPPSGSGQMGASAAPYTPPPGSLAIREELVRLLSSHETRLVEQFSVWDRGGDGVLSVRELERGLQSIGFADQPEHVQRLFDEIDIDSSGKIGFREFSAWVQQSAAELATKRSVQASADDTSRLSLSSRAKQQQEQQEQSHSPSSAPSSWQAEQPGRTAIAGSPAAWSDTSCSPDSSPFYAKPNGSQPSPRPPLSQAAARGSFSASRPTLMHRVAPHPAEDFGRPRAPRSRPPRRVAHRAAPVIRRPKGYAKFAACPFAMVSLTGFGFAHNGMASLLFDKSKVKARFFDCHTVGERSNAKESQKAAEAAMRDHGMNFGVADRDGSRTLDLDEFTMLITSKMGQDAKGEPLKARTIKTWFDSLDTDGDGSISMGEFFVFALQESLERSSAKGGLLGFFERWDTDDNNVMTRAEVERMAEKLGFGDVAKELLEEFDDNDSDAITYAELVGALRSKGKMTKVRNQFQNRYSDEQRAAKEMAKEGQQQQASAALSAPAPTAAGKGTGDLMALKQWLRKNADRVVDMFRLFDVDSDGDINTSELFKAISMVGYETSELVVQTLFDEIDADLTYRITFNELRNWLIEQEDELVGKQGAAAMTATATSASSPSTVPRMRRAAPSHEERLSRMLVGYESRYTSPQREPPTPQPSLGASVSSLQSSNNKRQLQASPSPPSTPKHRTPPAHPARRLIHDASPQTPSPYSSQSLSPQQRAKKQFTSSNQPVSGYAFQRGESPRVQKRSPYLSPQSARSASSPKSSVGLVSVAGQPLRFQGAYRWAPRSPSLNRPQSARERMHVAHVAS